MELSDQELTRRILAADPMAFGMLMARHRTVVEVVLSRLPAGEHDDARQEIWLLVLRKLAQYSSDRPFRPWLHKLALNCRNSYFRRYVLPRLQKEIRFEDLTRTQDNGLQSTTSPADAENSIAVTQAIQKLSASDQLVLQQRNQPDSTLAQRARDNNTSVAKQRGAEERAMMRVRPHLERWHE